MEIRLNKFISDSGYCSRREADRFVEKKKVKINGRMALMGDKVCSRDTVKVNGNLIEPRENYVYIALNKPVGITCTTDTTDTTNVIDLVNYPTRIFMIGRLDKDSEGLLLLTDNGDIVNKILRSNNKHEKEYEVTVDKSITPEFIDKMSDGIDILGVRTRKCTVVKEGDRHFRIILTQGLNRQIRRMCETLGYEVVRLKRVRVMNITIDKLPLEQWRFLESDEIAEILDGIKSSRNESKSSSSDTASKRYKGSGGQNNKGNRKLYSKKRTNDGARSGTEEQSQEQNREQKKRWVKSNNSRRSNRSNYSGDGTVRSNGVAAGSRNSNNNSGRDTVNSSRSNNSHHSSRNNNKTQQKTKKSFKFRG